MLGVGAMVMQVKAGAYVPDYVEMLFPLSVGLARISEYPIFEIVGQRCRDSSGVCLWAAEVGVKQELLVIS